jgi:hypothetical protein
MVMRRKVILAVVALVLIFSIGVVFAQETGYFLDITNSNASINSFITNSTVIENVTLTNGTLNINVNADNISSVTINGVNYTAAQPTTNSAPTAPTVIITYYGENTVPAGMNGFPYLWLYTGSNQTESNVYYYSWNLTMVNINPAAGIGGVLDSAFAPLVSKYPQLVTEYLPNPGIGQGLSNTLTLRCAITSFNGNLAKCCMVLFSNSQLSTDQIISLTQDLNTQLPPAIIDWFS